MIDDERLGPPPVEPLSEAAWSRVERGLWAEMDAAAATAARTTAPRRWWIIAAPLAAAALATAIVAIVIGGQRQAADVAVADEPSRVVSGSAPSSASFGDVHVELDADTALVMTHERTHPIAMLERGAAWFTVAPRHGRPAFLVRAGDATVRVVGTRFRVARSDERSVVEVEHGVVEVEFRGGAVELGASQRWSSDAPGRIAVAAVAAVAAAASPASPAAPAGPARVAPEAPRPVRAAPEPSPGARSPRPAANLATSTTPPRPAASRAASAEPDLGSAHVAHTADLDRDRDRAEYDRLAALEPRSPDAALAGYLVLARGPGPWADPALFAAARLAVDRRDRRAEALLASYLQRFPGGANAADARQLLARLSRDRP